MPKADHKPYDGACPYGYIKKACKNRPVPPSGSVGAAPQAPVSSAPRVGSKVATMLAPVEAGAVEEHYDEDLVGYKAEPEGWDSFEEYRAIREELHRIGVSAACRPLPEGAPIGGSAEGSKSVAQ